MRLRPIRALVAKDLRVFFTDRHTLVLSVAAPIALASFMAAIFGGAGAAPPSRIPIVLVDRDGGPVARAIVAGVMAEGRLVATTSGLDPALAEVRMGRAVVALEIPPGFGDDAGDAMVGDGPPPDLRFHLDPTRRPDVSMAQGVLTRIILEAVANDSMAVSGGLLDDLVPGGKPEAPAAGAGSRKVRMPYVARDVSIISDGAEADRGALAAHAFAGMVVQFALFSAVEWGVGLLTERRQGLWKRLRSAPVTMATLLASKLAGSFLACSMIIGIVFGFGALAFGFRVRGSVPGLVLMGAAFAWMASNFGLMVAALGRSPQGARSVSILAVLVMVMLGGGWIPGFLFPAWLQALTPAIPTRWAIDGFDGLISRGYSMAEAGPMLLALAGFGAGFGATALIAFRGRGKIEPDPKAGARPAPSWPRPIASRGRVEAVPAEVDPGSEIGVSGDRGGREGPGGTESPPSRPARGRFRPARGRNRPLWFSIVARCRKIDPAGRVRRSCLEGGRRSCPSRRSRRSTTSSARRRGAARSSTMPSRPRGSCS